LKLQTAMLAELPDRLPPASLRERVEKALVAERFVTTGQRAVRRPAVLRAAAGIGLFLLGGAAGTFVVAPGLDESAARTTNTLEISVPADLDGAVLALTVAESEYLRALSDFSELTDRGDFLDPLRRLAALEGIVIATGVALQAAPADPVINNYHLTALGQRDALLRRLEQVASADRWF
jgi:hypothetical protein